MLAMALFGQIGYQISQVKDQVGQDQGLEPDNSGSVKEEISSWRSAFFLGEVNTIKIKSSENKQQPGACRPGCSQWEEAKLAFAVEKLENIHTFFFIEGFP